ncbi:hypothetical protein CPLU01_13017 [Colletotrichum plurivorum]|uniref:ATP-dependent RNA helicase DHX8 n=1 Tax=Colletotrichum plurivorum TaxID=2175906 RepID=A0A8H6JUZ4_9PEZI|nr:hypothetical protein CPLU01_13017 [Colletotrichum plurivorum]
MESSNTKHDDSRDGGPNVPYRQIRANYDEETITVYQAYNTTIAAAAVESQLLTASPSFKLTRMTWIKPSWAWMLYRSGYSYKDPGQERILALKMTHGSFIDLLRKSALSHTDVKRDGKEVRVQWDPERDVRLGKLPYRSIQIGIPAGIWALKKTLEERPDVGDEELVDLSLIPCEGEFVVPEDVQDLLGMSAVTTR